MKRYSNDSQEHRKQIYKSSLHDRFCSAPCIGPGDMYQPVIFTLSDNADTHPQEDTAKNSPIPEVYRRITRTATADE